MSSRNEKISRGEALRAIKDAKKLISVITEKIDGNDILVNMLSEKMDIAEDYISDTYIDLCDEQLNADVPTQKVTKKHVEPNIKPSYSGGYIDDDYNEEVFSNDLDNHKNLEHGQEKCIKNNAVQFEEKERLVRLWKTGNAAKRKELCKEYGCNNVALSQRVSYYIKTEPALNKYADIYPRKNDIQETTKQCSSKKQLSSATIEERIKMINIYNTAAIQEVISLAESQGCSIMGLRQKLYDYCKHPEMIKRGIKVRRTFSIEELSIIKGETPLPVTQKESKSREDEIVEYYSNGFPVDEIAGLYEIPTNHVYRVLADKKCISYDDYLDITNPYKNKDRWIEDTGEKIKFYSSMMSFTSNSLYSIIYGEMTKKYGIVWLQEKKDYINKNGKKSTSTFQLVESSSQLRKLFDQCLSLYVSEFIKSTTNVSLSDDSEPTMLEYTQNIDTLLDILLNNTRKNKGKFKYNFNNALMELINSSGLNKLELTKKFNTGNIVSQTNDVYLINIIASSTSLMETVLVRRNKNDR